MKKVFVWLKKFFNKCIKPLFNKKWKVCIWIVIVLALIVSSFVIKSIPKKYADVALDFFEEEGYKCEIVGDYAKNYLCEFESDSGVLHQFSIYWGDKDTALDLLTWSSGFHVSYLLKHDGYSSFFGTEVFEKNYSGVYAYSHLINISECVFVASDWKDDYENYIDSSTDVVSLNNKYCDFDNNCISCSFYENEINYALDTFRNLYDELNMDLYEE